MVFTTGWRFTKDGPIRFLPIDADVEAIFEVYEIIVGAGRLYKQQLIGEATKSRGAAFSSPYSYASGKELSPP